MQMKMIDKAEAYENERRTQAAELIKINALLKGKQAEDDKIKLAVQSLNVSITALKRMKEIIEEIAFFFKSFADFMQAVADDAAHQIKAIDNVAELEVIRRTASPSSSAPSTSSSSGRPANGMRSRASVKGSTAALRMDGRSSTSCRGNISPALT